MSGRAKLPEHLAWLKANKHDLAPLTGTDRKALDAIAACWTLYASTGEGTVLSAVHILLAQMQPRTRPLARELIAWAMDWDDRDRVWPRVAPQVAPAAQPAPRTCGFEEAYVGDCTELLSDGESACAHHREQKCISCGAQANRTCSYAGQFVCGYPLCPNCEGTVDMSKPSGAWGTLNHSHRPKSPAEVRS